jgi:LysM repeat protein
MNPKSCPHLGLRNDTQTALGFPSQGNFCHHIKPPVPIRRDHQQNYCLSAGYTACPLIVQPDKKEALQIIDVDPTRRRLITLLKYGSALLLLLIIVAGAIIEAGKIFNQTEEIPINPTTNETQDPAELTAAVSSPSSIMTFLDAEITTTLYLPLTNAEEQLTPSPPLSECTVPSNWVEYTINPTDSLFRLSLLYNVNISDLQKVNCLGDRSILQPGEIIFVPIPATPTPTSTFTPSPTPTPRRPNQFIPTNTSAPPPPPEPVVIPTDTPPPPIVPTDTAPPPPPPTAVPIPTEPPIIPTPTPAILPSPAPPPTEAPQPADSPAPAPPPTEAPQPADSPAPAPTPAETAPDG